ncbi:fasciclin domain-containing protein [Pedobacter cryophilus]|uniref:Fasciclin domain-containing protein n=1 Tax=Pedobacter cryophilus TaxID=2571271 RepID=A0A4U1BVK8_9SPHI|nr:fasciclin domain-containing protein [Pedobacter cryophilus]TKB96237.1 fasciclin domain-containing protein [Pedobacter cryophilus]
MKKLFKLKKLQVMTALLFLLVIGFVACKKENFKQTTDDSVNITGYFEKDIANYSVFLNILKLTDNASFLGAYGTYTVFAPTDEAFKAYLTAQGKTSIDQVDINVLKDLVKLHLIEDTVSTTSFTDGKISKPTVSGQYLTTLAKNEGGVTRIVINKLAKILQGNIRVGNGIIHSIDHVLVKSERTLAQEISATPSLSIFNKLLIATGWDVKLNTPLSFVNGEGSYVSVLTTTNAAYKANDPTLTDDQIVAKLIAKYSNTGNPMNAADSLNVYVAYRVLPGLKYMADIVTASSHGTKAPLEIISVKLSKDSILFNEDVFAGVLEKGVSADRDISDVSTTNGVLHFVRGDFAVKKRVPTAVYWDVADQPEIRQLPGIFRVGGKFQSFTRGTLRDIRWDGGNNPVVTYAVSTTGNFAGAYYSDYLQISLRTAVAQFVEFRTPVVIRGRYKVWISFRSIRGSSNSQNTCSAALDGVPFSRTVSFGEYKIRAQGDVGSVASDPTPTELEAQGYKNPITFNSSNWNCRLLGTMDILTTDRHIFRLDALTNSNASSATIDMIHFIPIDQNQISPKFGPNGEIVY